MNRRTWGLLGFALLAALLGIAGFLLLFTAFKTYDDEGYVLYSLLNYATHGGLYSQVSSQYGPLFFLFNDGLHRMLQFEFTHTSARLLTLFYWLGSAVICGAMVNRYSRAPAWVFLGLSATFGHLWQMTAEPGHPGGLCTFLVAVGAWLGAESITRKNPQALALVVGLVGTALALIKINVGVFFFTGAGAWLALHTVGRGWRFGAAMMMLVPWLLMASLLGESWVLTFAVIATSATFSLFLATSAVRDAWFPARAWLWLFAVAIAVAGAVGVLTLSAGTAAWDLINGVLLAPLRHPGVYSFSIHWRPGASLCAILSAALCLLVMVRGWRSHSAFSIAVSWARLALLAAGVAFWLGWGTNAHAFVPSYGFSFAWLLVIPLRSDEAAMATARIRGWLGLLAITQFLQAYPVAGSQIGWGTFLWAPLLILAADEAVEVLSSRFRQARLIPLASLVSAAYLAVVLTDIGWERWSKSEPLRLPGAEVLRLPELLSARLRAVAFNARVHANHLFSLPGAYSFNVWSNRPTPTLANATHWFSLLDEPRQRQIIDQLTKDPQAAIVVEAVLLRFMREGNIAVGGPLYEHLKSEFTPAMRIGNYEFWYRRGHMVAPVSTVELYTRPDTSHAAEKYRLDVCLIAAPGVAVAQIEWLDCSHFVKPETVLTLNANNSRVEITPLDLNGRSTGGPAAVAFPFTPPSLARISVFTDAPLGELQRNVAVVRLRSADGALVGEAVFTH